MADGDSTAALTNWLVALRQRTPPSALGLRERPSSRPGPRVRGVTQEQVNTALNWGRGTYQALEKGRLQAQGRRIHTRHIMDIAELFHLDEDKYRQLHVLALGTQPPRPLRPETSVVVPSQAVWQRVVEGQREIAYVTNVQWDLVAWNRPFTRLFSAIGHDEGGGVPQNMMDWMLFSRPAREKLLVDWEKRWAPPILAQLHTVSLENPYNERLQQLMNRVREDPTTRRIYEAGVIDYAYPDGDERPLYHPDFGRGLAVMASAHPSSAPHARLIVVCFDRAGTGAEDDADVRAIPVDRVPN
ncbi:hypothetical protein ACFWZT_04005 [Streptomyces alboflavus]|uniref:MmyB family transcriptional regulator n=1 Tax=Streptomyces alboflavus TaxID=67267 RepID=UPI003682FF0F